MTKKQELIDKIALHISRIEEALRKSEEYGATLSPPLYDDWLKLHTKLEGSIGRWQELLDAAHTQGFRPGQLELCIEIIDEALDTPVPRFHK